MSRRKEAVEREQIACVFGLTGGELNDLRLDFLASLEPTPGTVAFLGYGRSMQSNATLSLQNLQRTSDGFFVKLAYQFRR